MLFLHDFKIRQSSCLFCQIFRKERLIVMTFALAFNIFAVESEKLKYIEKNTK